MGAPRKGFDVAVLEGAEVVEIRSAQDAADVARVVTAAGAPVAGIDSPAGCAPPGEKSRAGERELAREVCPIFFTPDEEVVRSGHSFYGWMEHGLDLYDLLARSCPGTTCVEVFPSAAWTVIAGPREGRPKPQWSRTALELAGVRGLPARSSQDCRDAAGAALVAQLHHRGLTVDYGGIAVPRRGAVAFPG